MESMIPTRGSEAVATNSCGADVIDFPKKHPFQTEEGVFDLDHPYDPKPGILVPEKIKEIEGGTVHIGTYVSERASHRVGIYRPDGYDTQAENPVVLKTMPLGTGVKGHGQNVAAQMMQAGFLVIKKGVPRYDGPTLKALSLDQDANEMLGLLQEVDRSGKFGNIGEVFGYGESQAAMKLLSLLGITNKYGFDPIDGLAVATCFLKRINYLRPDKQLFRFAGIMAGVARFVAQSTPEERQVLKGTFSRKDLHHHAAVMPVLISGQAGDALEYIHKDQIFTVQLFGKDGYSKPHRAQAEFKERFPNVDARINEKYGHVDGIMSNDTRVLRELMLFEIAKSYDMKPAQKTTLRAF